MIKYDIRAHIDAMEGLFRLHKILDMEQDRQLAAVARVRKTWKGPTAETLQKEYEDMLLEGLYEETMQQVQGMYNTMMYALPEMEDLKNKCENFHTCLTGEPYERWVLGAYRTPSSQLMSDSGAIATMCTYLENISHTNHKACDALSDLMDACGGLIDFGAEEEALRRTREKTDRVLILRDELNSYAHRMQSLDYEMTRQYAQWADTDILNKIGTPDRVASILTGNETAIAEFTALLADGTFKPEALEYLASIYANVIKQQKMTWDQAAFLIAGYLNQRQQPLTAAEQEILNWALKQAELSTLYQEGTNAQQLEQIESLMGKECLTEMEQFFLTTCLEKFASMGDNQCMEAITGQLLEGNVEERMTVDGIKTYYTVDIKEEELRTLKELAQQYGATNLLNYLAALENMDSISIQTSTPEGCKFTMLSEVDQYGLCKFVVSVQTGPDNMGGMTEICFQSDMGVSLLSEEEIINLYENRDTHNAIERALDKDKKDDYIYNQHIANAYQQIQMEQAAQDIHTYGMEEYLNYLYGDTPDADSPRIAQWNAKCEEACAKLQEWEAMGIDMDAVQTYYYYQRNQEELKTAEDYAKKDPLGATFLSFADKFIGNISSGIYEATHFASGEALNYNSAYYMPGKKADITRATVANNLAEDIGGMGGAFAKDAYLIGVATGDILVEAGVDAAFGFGMGTVSGSLRTAAKATSGTIKVVNAVDNVGDAWRMMDNLDDSFDTIKGFNRMENSLDTAKTLDKVEDGLSAAKSVDKVEDNLDTLHDIQKTKEKFSQNPLAGQMSTEEAEKYLNFLKNGSQEGLTDAELLGIHKVDDQIALNKVNYQDVLDLRKADRGVESGKKTLLESTPDEIANMTRKELQDSIPEGWDFQDHNGRIHIKDENGNFRVRIDPPDKKTDYTHIHIMDENKNPLDINGNIVSPKDPSGHIPYND